MVTVALLNADGLVPAERMWGGCSSPGALTLDELLGRPPWHCHGACRSCDPGIIFFPRQGEPNGPAKAVCAGCAVQDACRTWALAQGDALVGVWGGTSHIERVRERRRLRRLQRG